MKASELRIGNWVNSEGIFYATDQPYAKIGAIGPGKSIGLERTNTSSLDGGDTDQIAPIPLNEEWLIKLGFVRVSSYDDEWCIESYRHFRIAFDRDGDIGTAHLGRYKGTYKIIDYVHQLQNLYFALTGTELTIKE